MSRTIIYYYRMKHIHVKIITFAAAILVSSSALTLAQSVQQEEYVPESQELYDEIVSMDSLWGDSYNNCKIDVMDSLISSDLEFYHDRGGFTASKESVMNAYKNNVCGKVTRELLKGSIEVYPVHNYGAVQMGRHRFYTNEEEKNNNHHFSKFVHIWKNENGSWKITRVISLH